MQQFKVVRPTLWTDCDIASFNNQKPYGFIRQAAIAVEDFKIAWIGPLNEIPQRWSAPDVERISARGQLITPGLIDCHTHLVYGGSRAREFEKRLQGVSYEDIAKAGGGILSTVKATRESSVDSLVRQSLPRARCLVQSGVTTIEIKSGYGLSYESERQCLLAAREIAKELAITVKTTYLGAHALPPEFSGRSDDYVTSLIDTLHRLYDEGLVDAVDAFCEKIAFSPAQVERVFRVAQSLGLPVKLHAEQLSDSAGTQLAAKYGALSCDHLEWLSPEGIDAMLESGSVAVLLPSAFYFLRETKVPPIAALRAAGVPMAVSTDCNPGSSPNTSLLLAMNMASTLFRMTPEEALAGATVHAASALGLKDRGRLAVGQRADLAFWSVTEPAELVYGMGHNPCLQTTHQ